MACGDVIAQTAIEKKRRLEVTRTLRFFGFGALFGVSDGSLLSCHVIMVMWRIHSLFVRVPRYGCGIVHWTALYPPTPLSAHSG